MIKALQSLSFKDVVVVCGIVVFVFIGFSFISLKSYLNKKEKETNESARISAQAQESIKQINLEKELWNTAIAYQVKCNDLAKTATKQFKSVTTEADFRAAIKTANKAWSNCLESKKVIESNNLCTKFDTSVVCKKTHNAFYLQAESKLKFDKVVLNYFNPKKYDEIVELLGEPDRHLIFDENTKFVYWDYEVGFLQSKSIHVSVNTNTNKLSMLSY